MASGRTYVGGIYAELGLDTSGLEAGIGAAERKLKSCAAETQKLHDAFNSGKITYQQYALQMRSLNAITGNTERSLSAFRSQLANVINYQMSGTQASKQWNAAAAKFAETTQAAGTSLNRMAGSSRM